MKRCTLGDIVGMESLKTEEKKSNYEKIRLLQKKNYSIAKEGLFDFFRKRKEEDVQEKKKNLYMEPGEHLQELAQGTKVSIHLQTVSVDEEIKFLEDLIRNGLPFFKKDIERLTKCFKFILANGTSTIDKLAKLVEIAYPSSYDFKKEMSAIEFDTFVVSVHNFADTKEKQMHIGSSAEMIRLRETPQFTKKYGNDLTDEEIQKYETMYFLDEAIPNLDEIVPKKRTTKDQKRIYLEKGDPKVQKLLDLNMELIEQSSKIMDEDKYDSFFDLITNADSSSHPVDIGDDYGLMVIYAHSSSYLSDLVYGFKQDFIKNYTAH
jgi:hypothetical protein